MLPYPFGIALIVTGGVAPLGKPISPLVSPHHTHPHPPSDQALSYAWKYSASPKVWRSLPQVFKTIFPLQSLQDMSCGNRERGLEVLVYIWALTLTSRVNWENYSSLWASISSFVWEGRQQWDKLQEVPRIIHLLAMDKSYFYNITIVSLN